MRTKLHKFLVATALYCGSVNFVDGFRNGVVWYELILIIVFTLVAFALIWYWSDPASDSRLENYIVETVIVIFCVIGLIMYTYSIFIGPKIGSEMGPIHIAIFPVLHTIVAVSLILIATILFCVLRWFLPGRYKT